MKHANLSPKILLLDDDPDFGRLLEAVAQHSGLDLRFYDSLISLGGIARLGEFELILCDYFLTYIKGSDVAHYVNTFFSDIPIIFVSANLEAVSLLEEWPDCVIGLLPKSFHARELIQSALEIYRAEKALVNDFRAC